jgi:hypothetical protein
MINEHIVQSNNSLDRNGWRVFCNLIGPARLEWMRATQSTLTGRVSKMMMASV